MCPFLSEEGESSAVVGDTPHGGISSGVVVVLANDDVLEMVWLDLEEQVGGFLAGTASAGVLRW